jgi:hypothetical protein
MSAGTGSARHARRTSHPSPTLLSWVAGAVIYPLAGCGTIALSAYGFLTSPGRTLAASLLAVVMTASPEAVRRARHALWTRRCRAKNPRGTTIGLTWRIRHVLTCRILHVIGSRPAPAAGRGRRRGTGLGRPSGSGNHIR